MGTQGEKWTEQVLTELHRIGRRRRGSISYAEGVVKKSSGYLRRRRASGTIELSKCLDFMDALGVHPARFFRQVFPFDGDEVSCYMDVPQGEPPAIIARAHERLASTRESSIPHAYLLDLDELRYQRPMQAAKGAFEAILFIDPADVPFALGVWGSAQRLLLEFDYAAHALSVGLEIAQARKDHGSFGNLLQRVASVLGDHGNYRGSFFLAKEATDRHLLAEDMAAVGRTFVDRGIWLYYLEDFQEAIAMQGRALRTLPDSESRQRFSAFQVMGLCYQVLGELDTAQHFSLQALKEAEGLGPLLKGKQIWLQASICFERGALDEAEALLKEVAHSFADIHAGESALATIDLAEVQLKADKPSAAYDSALAILPLITPLGARSRVVRSAEHALRELAARGAKSMTYSFVSKLRKLVEKIRRERHLWRSLLKMS